MAARKKVDQFDRARRAWPILIEQAKQRSPITYGRLAEKMELHPRVCRYFLGIIQDHCLEKDLPPLQSLVINKRTKVPGSGYFATPRGRVQIDEAHNQVFGFKWNSVNNPF